MAVDLSVFERIRTPSDYRKAEEEFNQKKQLRQAQIERAQNVGSGDPAVVKIANELQKARAAGDMQRVSDLERFAKVYDKGVTTDQYGKPIAMNGYGDAVGSIAGTKKTYEADAQNRSDLYYDPITAGREAQQKYQQQSYYEPMIKQDIAQREANVQLDTAADIEAQKQRGQSQGKKQGDVLGELNERLASLPQLMDTVQKLSDLGKKATYTYTGRVGDAIRNEVAGLTGMVEPSEGAQARSEYISLVDNQILPLLRQTFGAQFTVQEGESLRATLGNVNLTPKQKDAALRSFIDQKIATIQSQQRELGLPVEAYSNPLEASQNAIQKQQEQIGSNPNQRENLREKAEREFNERKGKTRLKYNPQTGEFE